MQYHLPRCCLLFATVLLSEQRQHTQDWQLLWQMTTTRHLITIQMYVIFLNKATGNLARDCSMRG